MDQYIKVAIEHLGEKYFKDNISFIEIKNNPNHLEVKKDSDGIFIYYGSRSLLFYGLTLIKQNSKKDKYDIKINKHFQSNGLMHDCSRNGALNDEQIKRMLLTSALFGLNRFYLYIEDIYEIPEEPYFGYLRGRYTKQELIPLLEFAKGLGITIIPCIQTLSHLNGMLKWTAYWDIFETDYTMTTGMDKTYQLIEKMIRAVKDIFQTSTIHIGMDETWDIGLGRYRKKNIVVDKTKEYLNHLNKVAEICQKLNVKPLMWGDMFFQLDMNQTEGSWYKHEGPFKKEVKDLIPDVGLVYWDYYNTDYDLYVRLLKTLKDTNKETYFASGAISWIGYAPNIIQSLDITRVGLKAALDEQIENVFTTSWGDNGNECSVITSYPTLALHALYDYYERCDEKSLSSLLKAVTGDDLSTWKTLQLPNDLNETMSAYNNPSKPFLYQDILTGLFDKRVLPHYANKYRENRDILIKSSKKSKQNSYIYQNLAALCDLLSYKVNIGLRLRDAYKNQDKNELFNCLKDIKIIKTKLEKFINTMRKQWYIENKPFGFDIIDGRLGFLKNRVDTAIITIDDYLKGKIKTIDELEEEILLWNDYEADKDRLIGYWTEMASANVY